MRLNESYELDDTQSVCAMLMPFKACDAARKRFVDVIFILAFLQDLKLLLKPQLQKHLVLITS